MKSLDMLSFAVVAAGLAMSGCAQNNAPSSSDPSIEIAASQQVRSRFGIDHYSVQIGDTAAVGLRAADGLLIASMTTYRLPDGTALVRLSGSGSVTDITSNADTLTILRDGVVRYTLDRAAASAATGLADLEATARPVPSDLAPALGLASAVATDPGLMEYLAQVSPNTAYLVKDCPWWVTLAACVGWETGVGAVMCVACGASYLL